MATLRMQVTQMLTVKAFDDVSYEKSGEAQVGRLTSFVTVFDRKED